MSDEDRIFAHGVAIVCLCLPRRRVVNDPPLSKFFAYTWRAGKPEITEYKCTRNKFTCKHWVLSLPSLPNDFHLFRIPFSIQGSLLIQINSLRRNNNVFTSNPLHLVSGYLINRGLSRLSTSSMTRLVGQARGCSLSIHQTESLFILLHVARKSPDCRRITPPSYIK